MNSFCMPCNNSCKQYEFATIIKCPHCTYKPKYSRQKKIDEPFRVLTSQEKREIKELVLICANYCKVDNLCLPLDSSCFMLNKGVVTGGICKYFTAAVLPLNPRLEQILCKKAVTSNKACCVCGSLFPAQGRKKYCSEQCKVIGTRNQEKMKKRNQRKNKG